LINYDKDGTIYTLWNNSYSDIRGLEFRFEKNYGLWRVRTNYTYMIRSRGQAGGVRSWEDPVQELAERENTVRTLSETRWQPTPYVRGTLGFFSPRNWGPAVGDHIHPLDNIIINMIYSWSDGGERVHLSGLTPDLHIWIDNLDRTNTDLRAEKRIGIGRKIQLGLFVQVYNLWNQKYLLDPNGNQAYGSDAQKYWDAIRYTDKNGSSTPPGNDQWGEYKPEHLRDVIPWWHDNILFNDKRDVYYGMSLTWN
jgi:outer membrane receptor protein involved in Fe transport